MDKFTEIKSLEAFELAKKDKSVFLFTASWCPDCMFIKPFIGDIVTDNPQFKFYVIDRDEFIDLCIDLDIMGIPSFVGYNQGEEIGRLVNKLRKTKEEIQSFIDSMK